MREKKNNQCKTDRVVVRQRKNDLVVRDKDDPMQCYGYIVANIGDSRMSVMCSDSIRRVCRIRGALRGRVWIRPWDIVLVSARNFRGAESSMMAGEEGDILHKYNDSEVAQLKAANEIDENFGVNNSMGMPGQSADRDTEKQQEETNEQEAQIVFSDI
jgi:translation initiation factor 1A